MTSLERIRRARCVLVATVSTVALLSAASAGMAVIVLAALTALFMPLPPSILVTIVLLAITATIAAATFVVWRGRAAGSVERVALWVEEHDPSLHFVLVTAIDPALAPAAQHPALHAAAAGADVEAIVRRAALRALGAALLTFVGTGAIFTLLHAPDVLRGLRSELLRRAGIGAIAPLGNRLATLSARVQPPAYARMRVVSIDEPTGILALNGSRVTLTGRGPADGVVAAMKSDSIPASAARGGWAVETAMPAEPVVVALHDREYRRLVTLEPRPDSAPNVKLRLPAADTTYQTVPTGSLTVEAAVEDDIGLAFGFVEYMLSSGSEESFDTKVFTSKRVAFGNARTATLREVIRFDTLKLAPGSVLHIRAVAYDFNDVTGPGKGVSETRTLRVAEPIDSTSLNAAPPLPIDTLWVSQRLLNMRTDTLIHDKRRLARGDFVGRSSVYGNTQDGIRRRVLNVITLLEADGVGGALETETSTKLREVADLMLTARTDLGIALPDTAMPYMRKILKILDELRLAHRYYLRGLLKPVAVNVERVRLSGKDSAAAVSRQPRPALDDPAAALLVRLDVAAAIGAEAPAVAAESLTYIRVTALKAVPAAAPAMQSAIAAIARGVPVAIALAPARRALAPRSRVVASPPEWAGVVP